MKYYQIADFIVGVSTDILVKSRDLSYGFEKFEIDSSGVDDVDFYLQFLNQDQKRQIREKKNLVFSYSECAYPTFVYKLENGGYECQFLNDDETIGLVFYISNDWKKINLALDRTEDAGFTLFNRIGALFNIVLLYHNACVFHGVVMEYQGKGILVMAPAGTGKSTHTNMWEERENASIINGDRCLCRCIEGMWYTYGMPWAGSSKKILNRKIHISTIVILERSEKNDTEQSFGFHAEISLLQRIFAPVTYGKLQENAFDMVHDIVEKIPVVRLMCRPDYEAVDVLKKTLSELWER